MRLVYRAYMYTVFGPNVEIVGKVPGPRLCVCVCVCACVCACVPACLRACVWYTDLTCIPYFGPKADIVGQVGYWSFRSLTISAHDHFGP